MRTEPNDAEIALVALVAATGARSESVCRDSLDVAEVLLRDEPAGAFSPVVEDDPNGRLGAAAKLAKACIVCAACPRGQVLRGEIMTQPPRWRRPRRS